LPFATFDSKVAVRARKGWFHGEMMMSEFSVDGFAAACKEAMASADGSHKAMKACLDEAMAENTPAEVIAALEAAVPAGADIGELIVHASPELTMLYGRIPPRFQSATHNHTVVACIAQLEGEEISHIYRRDGDGLRFIDSKTAVPGDVVALAADAIHGIENPNPTTGGALHVYGGDFGAIVDQRSLWSADRHEEIAFFFPAPLKESVKTMKRAATPPVSTLSPPPSRRPPR
jgi:predicted metal-dependent enzyme (double-stranded beta helix superfamily)